MNANSSWDGLDADNAVWLEQQYERFKHNPGTMSPSWQEWFDRFEEEKPHLVVPKHKQTESSVVSDLKGTEWAYLAVQQLIDAYERYGHLAVQPNNIALQERPFPEQLELARFGLNEYHLSQNFPTLGVLEQPQARLDEILARLKTIYAGAIGIEFKDRLTAEGEAWLKDHLEHPEPLTIEQKKMILDQLNRSELLEVFLHTKFTGQKRFSLEGAETLIPMLEVLLEKAGHLGVRHCYIGMAHRGRLNVLSNILKKSHRELFSEFEEGLIPNTFQGSGDVKYHKGFTSQVDLPTGDRMTITVGPNPSHLEAVDPVIEGMARAMQDQASYDKQSVLPILIHGDAALAGQGVVYETMQMSRLAGYGTGGTVHLVINNQIGFTATPDETRSTYYCTDIAAGFGAPVFHVNAEEPENCLFVTLLAIELRQKYGCDVFIDLNCYRKYGHNESDEPAFTQPLEYQSIRKKRPIRELYRDQLIHEGVVEQHIAESLELEFSSALQKTLEECREAKKQRSEKSSENDTERPNQISIVQSYGQIKTAVSYPKLVEVAEKLNDIPVDLKVHPKLVRLIHERLAMVKTGNGKKVDWGMGELLAYATLVSEGIDLRLAGQDSQRGTFSHRHAVWIDQEKEFSYCSLQHLKEQDQGRVEVVNSFLSEYAALGFEYGYSVVSPRTFVLWEAQFGDFSNGAQIIIDQFLHAAEQKWGQTSSLTLLLPHGYEGQGPEHSSARMERYLLLTAEENVRVANVTSPAQLFHLLRSQALSTIKKPLILFTPKAMLRYPECQSEVGELTKGYFELVLDDPAPPKTVRRLCFCSGKIYYDLMRKASEFPDRDCAFIRIEQLYPFPKNLLMDVVSSYKAVKEWIWVQEEPENMGAAEFIQPLLLDLLPEKTELSVIARARSASPATGSHATHDSEWHEIVQAVFLGTRGKDEG